MFYSKKFGRYMRDFHDKISTLVVETEKCELKEWTVVSLSTIDYKIGRFLSVYWDIRNTEQKINKSVDLTSVKCNLSCRDKFMSMFLTLLCRNNIIENFSFSHNIDKTFFLMLEQTWLRACQTIEFELEILNLSDNKLWRLDKVNLIEP